MEDISCHGEGVTLSDSAHNDVESLKEELETLRREIEYLKKVDQMRTEMAMIVYHDLRAPLAAIQTCLSVVLEGISGPINEKQKDMIQRAERDVDKLLNFIRDLLEFSKLTVEQVNENMEPVQLSSMLKKTLDLLEFKAREKNLSVETDFPETLPLVCADRLHIEQVMRNVIGNAVKYNRDGGYMSVVAREDKDGQSLTVIVADTGIGIPHDDLPKIFDLFHRGENAKEKVRVGTGLGLCIAKRIIESHGGSIAVASELDKGTEVTIQLPISRDE